MKKSKIIIPALAMMVMSTAATVTGTVAWFSMNKVVTAAGMTVKAAADASLLIKGAKDSKFGSVGTTEVTATSMKPCTSSDGLNFGYLGNDVTVTSDTNSSATWSGASGAFQDGDLVSVPTNGKVGDVVYVASAEYNLKSINAGKDVYVESILVGGGTTDTGSTHYADFKAIRFSITFDGVTTQMFNPKSGVYNDNKVGSYSGTAWSLVAADTGISWSSTGNEAAKIGTCPAQTTGDAGKVVTVRIWFEGQDTSCYSEIVDPSAYTITVQFRGEDAA